MDWVLLNLMKRILALPLVIAWTVSLLATSGCTWLDDQMTLDALEARILTHDQSVERLFGFTIKTDGDTQDIIIHGGSITALGSCSKIIDAGALYYTVDNPHFSVYLSRTRLAVFSGGRGLCQVWYAKLPTVGEEALASNQQAMKLIADEIVNREIQRRPRNP